MISYGTNEYQQDRREDLLAAYADHFFSDVEEVEESMMHNETHFLIVQNIQEIMQNVRYLNSGSEFQRQTRLDAVIRAATQMTRKMEDYVAEEFDRGNA